MEYYEPKEMIEALEKYPNLRELLYCRGFIVTNEKQQQMDGYPFYGNWVETKLNKNYYIYSHNKTDVYVYENDGVSYFLIGNAYNPFDMIVDENEILKNLSKARAISDDDFWKEESKLTGVFFVGFVDNNNITYTTDCVGMQLVYYGEINKKLYITPHAKVVADLKGLEQPEYIKRLVNSKYWHYWGTWLPGDTSPFAEMKRVVPNHSITYCPENQKFDIDRFYPKSKIVETQTEDEYKATIKELGRIMSNTMECISKKWADKKVSVSVTGGRDSMTTLACSNKVYDKLSYFSYISNVDESVDAYAARDILKHLGLKHELYEIPEKWEDEQELDAFKKVMASNNGCIGLNNANDLRKRLHFAKNPPCDVEVKSWVNEVGRGWMYNKYNKKKFPKYPYASYWRAMHKLYVSKYLIKETDKIFAEYLEKYYDKEVFDSISWLELYFWEFTCSASEGNFLTTEHKISYNITIPFNNRKYLELMFTVPIAKRKVDDIPVNLITYMEPRIAETGITIKDISHTNFRAFTVRTYLEVFSKIRFGRKKEVYE